LHILRELESLPSWQLCGPLVSLAHVIKRRFNYRSTCIDVCHFVELSQRFPGEQATSGDDVDPVESFTDVLGERNGDIVASYSPLSL
jgi:hypothetical protein